MRFSVDLPMKEELETRAGFPCRAFRWVFRLRWNFVGFVHQHDLDGWRDSHSRVWCLSFDEKHPLEFGSTHIWYDGPHCGFAFGPFRAQWHNNDCQKCMGER